MFLDSGRPEQLLVPISVWILVWVATISKGLYQIIGEKRAGPVVDQRGIAQLHMFRTIVDQVVSPSQGLQTNIGIDAYFHFFSLPTRFCSDQDHPVRRF